MIVCSVCGVGSDFAVVVTKVLVEGDRDRRNKSLTVGLLDPAGSMTIWKPSISWFLPPNTCCLPTKIVGPGKHIRMNIISIIISSSSSIVAVVVIIILFFNLTFFIKNLFVVVVVAVALPFLLLFFFLFVFCICSSSSSFSFFFFIFLFCFVPSDIVPPFFLCCCCCCCCFFLQILCVGMVGGGGGGGRGAHQTPGCHGIDKTIANVIVHIQS